ncbi:MAG: hypothetical protein EZS28_024478 [Streblomastix strix]|uniref:Uncharacterized protein n=1 Tax=Streblomastix strix TaxID=222440 RepID=A0A5J4VC01_9EUKA|nr:MAG: hypothetical protein EZS28_024478 [Streblomastix strix]
MWIDEGRRMVKSLRLMNTRMRHFMDGNCFGVAVRGGSFWFRQKTRGTNVAASKAEAPFTGRGNAERMVLALSKVFKQTVLQLIQSLKFGAL